MYKVTLRRKAVIEHSHNCSVVYSLIRKSCYETLLPFSTHCSENRAFQAGREKVYTERSAATATSRFFTKIGDSFSGRRGIVHSFYLLSRKQKSHILQNLLCHLMTKLPIDWNIRVISGYVLDFVDALRK